MKAILKNYRQSPRKVRLVADVVRGKKVSDAIAALQFVDKRASSKVPEDKSPAERVVRSAKLEVVLSICAQV